MSQCIAIENVQFYPVLLHYLCCNWFPVLQKELRVHWTKTEGSRTVSFDHIPFSVAEVKLLDCQFGEKYYKQKPTKGEKLWLQGTRKHGCAAHITVKSYTLYLSYGIDKENKKLSKWKLRCLCTERLSKLREDLVAKKEIKTDTKYFFSFPSEAAHSECPTG